VPFAKTGADMKVIVNGTEYYVKYKTGKDGRKSLVIYQFFTEKELKWMESVSGEEKHEG